MCLRKFPSVELLKNCTDEDGSRQNIKDKAQTLEGLSMASNYYNTSSAIKGDAKVDQSLGVDEVWAECLAYFREVLEPREIQTWFLPISPIKLEGATLTIRVPTLYFYEILEANYAETFSHILTQLLGSEAKLRCEALVDSSAKDVRKGSMTTVSGDIRGRYTSEQQTASTPPKVFFDPHLIRNYTFETFLGGVSNNVPRTFALHICEHPGKPVINPFFIYGAPGVGKTHLINAIGQQLLRNDPSLRILYVSADNFIQQFTAASCNHKTADFTKFYRQVDVLLIDDIQMLVGKTKTQEAFFQIFNHLYMLGKQIILTCDKPPVEIHGMEERLVSRIAGSCVAHIERPDEELRRNFLEKKLREEGIELREDVKDLIVKSVTSNLRELEGVLTSLMLHSIVDKRAVDLKFSKEILARTVKMDAREITLDLILQLTSEFLGVSEDDIRGKSRKQEIALARQIVMYLAKIHTEDSYGTIGVKLGNRSHSTVVHGYNNIEAQMELNPLVQDCVKSIQEKLKI